MDTLPPHEQDSNIPLKRCPACPDGQQWHPATTDFFHYQKGRKYNLSSHCKSCKNKSQREKNRIPEVREKRLAQQKAYASQSEVKERKLAWLKAYRDRPEVRIHRKAYSDSYTKRPEVKTHKRAYDKDYRCRPGHRERVRASVSRYQNSPKGRERRKAYQSRPDVCRRMRFNERVYRDTPKGQLNSRTKQQNRMARKKAIPGMHTHQQIQEQLRRQRFRCYYAACGFSKFQRVKENGVWKYIGYEIEHTYPISRVVGTGIPANDMSYLVLACPTCNGKKQDKFPWEWFEGGRLL